MRDFELQRPLKNSVWQIYKLKAQIDLDPPYQREGEVWSEDKKQLLIDTIINEFDVPKIYFHQDPSSKGANVFAVVDGKQRLSAIWEFINNGFALADRFKYFEDETVDLSGMTYKEIADKYPDIKTNFDSYQLDIISIVTTDIEVIEDLFSRLNEAVPLNAAERRNAYHGPLPRLVRSLVKDAFFAKKLPFSNKRYRHYDLVAKFLMISERDKIIDTKKVYLDKFFTDNNNLSRTRVTQLARDVKSVLAAMSGTFVDRDSLLRQVSMVTVLYHTFRLCSQKRVLAPTRSQLSDFEKTRKSNRQAAALDIGTANYELLEFDRFAQSPNDPIAVRYRVAVLDKYLLAGRLGMKEHLAESNE
jgi:hypothetical protein